MYRYFFKTEEKEPGTHIHDVNDYKLPDNDELSDFLEKRKKMTFPCQTKRRNCNQIMVGSVPIGGNAPISVQSMTNTDTRDIVATIAHSQNNQSSLARHEAATSVGDLVDPNWRCRCPAILSNSN